jgi:hypothetical protein
MNVWGRTLWVARLISKQCRSYVVRSRLIVLDGGLDELKTRVRQNPDVTHLRYHAPDDMGLTQVDAQLLALPRHLEYLNLDHCSVSCSDLFQGCPQLSTLKLERTFVSDVFDLHKHSQLTCLDLGNCTMIEPASLGELFTLESLRLYRQGQRFDMSSCPQITSLEVVNPTAVSLVSWASCSELVSLTLEVTGVSHMADIIGVRMMSRLVSLDISNACDLVDITPLSARTQLQTLCLNNVAVEDISALEHCTQLKKVTLTECSHLVSIAPLAGCTQLTSLSLARSSSVVDISMLSSCVQLTTLSLCRCDQIEDISALAACTTALVALNLIGCKPSLDVKALCASLPALRVTCCIIFS